MAQYPSCPLLQVSLSGLVQTRLRVLTIIDRYHAGRIAPLPCSVYHSPHVIVASPSPSPASSSSSPSSAETPLASEAAAPSGSASHYPTGSSPPGGVMRPAPSSRGVAMRGNSPCGTSEPLRGYPRRDITPPERNSDPQPSAPPRHHSASKHQHGRDARGGIPTPFLRLDDSDEEDDLDLLLLQVRMNTKHG